MIRFNSSPTNFFAYKVGNMGKYQLVILMAGKSNRFLEAGYGKPKALLEANEKRILNRIVDSFRNADEVLIIASDQQKLYLHDVDLGYCPSKEIISCFIEAHDLGPSESLLRARNQLSDSKPVVVTYCDLAVEMDDEVLISELDLFDATCVVFSGFHPHTIRKPKFGYIKADGENRIIEVREKTSFSDNPLKENASTGIYAFRSKDILIQSLNLQKEKTAQVNGEYYVSLAVDQLVQQGGAASIMSVCRFACWGTPEDLEDFNHYSKIQEIILGRDIGGRVLGATNLYLAGGQGERTRHITGVYKSLLPLNEELGTQLWMQSGGRVEEDDAESVSYFVSHPEVLNEIRGKEKFGKNLVTLPLNEQTKDACETAEFALKVIGECATPISIIASDNLVGFLNDTNLAEMDYDLLVWLAVSYPIADMNAEQYSWALVSDTDRIERVSVKEKPIDGNHWYTIAGNFTFKNIETAKELVSSARLERPAKKEQHLESVIEVAIKKGMKVKSLFIDNYMSVGVADEILLFNYLKNGTYSNI